MQRDATIVLLRQDSKGYATATAPGEATYYVVLTFSPDTETTLSQHYGMPEPCDAVARPGQAGGVLTPGQEGDRCYLFPPSPTPLSFVVHPSDNPNRNNIALYVYEHDDQLGDPPKAGVLLGPQGDQVLDAFDQISNRDYPRWVASEQRPEGEKGSGIRLTLLGSGPGPVSRKNRKGAGSQRTQESSTSLAFASPQMETRWIVALVIGIISSVAAALMVMYFMKK